MPAMRRKKKNNRLTVALTALIVLSLAAIVFVAFFHREEPVGSTLPAGQKKPARQAKTASPEKPRPQPTAETARERSAVPATPEAAPPAEKEKVVIAKAAPPRLSLKAVAVIIDDIGYDMQPVRELLSIDADITFAVLPLLPHSREAALLLHRARRETLLHLPMEPASYPKDKPGNGALFTEMSEEEIVLQLEKNLNSVPHAVGVNNHMGSKFMADGEKLEPVFRQLKKRNMFFIDSRTTPSSKTAAVAARVHLTVASRRIFLDNERDYDKIYRILMDVADAPAGNGPVIVIGHPYPETIRALRDASRIFQEKGVSILPASKLLKRNAADGAS